MHPKARQGKKLLQTVPVEEKEACFGVILPLSSMLVISTQSVVPGPGAHSKVNIYVPIMCTFKTELIFFLSIFNAVHHT